jgi:ATP-binding protein involved in chromosome partitioning
MNIVKISRITELKVGSSNENDLVGKGIEIVLNNGEIKKIDSLVLRKNCPCASCLEKRGDTSHSAPLSGTPVVGRALLTVVKNSAVEEPNITKIWNIGNYALGMRYSDGHDSGIYTYKFLTELSI